LSDDASGPDRTVALPHSSKERAVTFLLECLDGLFGEGTARTLEAIISGVEVDEVEFET